MSYNIGVLKTSQNSQENTCVGVSFLKVAVLHNIYITWDTTWILVTAAYFIFYAINVIRHVQHIKPTERRTMQVDFSKNWKK